MTIKSAKNHATLPEAEERATFSIVVCKKIVGLLKKEASIRGLLKKFKALKNDDNFVTVDILFFAF